MSVQREVSVRKRTEFSFCGISEANVHSPACTTKHIFFVLWDSSVKCDSLQMSFAVFLCTKVFLVFALIPVLANENITDYNYLHVCICASDLQTIVQLVCVQQP